MRWKQFLTPVRSINSEEAQQLIQADSEIELLDVRQPGEYHDAHIPGAKLIPLPKLGDNLEQLDKNRTCIVYCAIGGRSRVAAQQLAGYGFTDVINLSGGIKGWDGHTAAGDQDQGMELFTELSSVEDVLKIAYSLEDGLKDFYLTMKEQVVHPETKSLFEKLSHIEDLHKDRLFEEYKKVSGDDDRDGFEKSVATQCMEGGLTTSEYMGRFSVTPDTLDEIISIAMSIEAQALDLYTRGARITKTPESKTALKRIADEEKQHLERLGILMDSILEENHG